MNSIVEPNFKVKFIFFLSCGSHEQYLWTQRNETQTHWIAQNVLSKLTLSLRLKSVFFNGSCVLFTGFASTLFSKKKL